MAERGDGGGVSDGVPRPRSPDDTGPNPIVEAGTFYDDGGSVDDPGYAADGPDYDDDLDADGPEHGELPGAGGPGARDYAGDPRYDADARYWATGTAAPPPTGRRRSRRRRHPVLAAFLLLMVVVILLAGSGILWAAHQINPGGHQGPKVLVTIPVGASSSVIGTDLAKAGIIHSGKLFRYYLKVEGGSPLLAGTYRLATNESYDEVIATLQAGPVILTDKLVIPEGFTFREIATRVAQLPGMHLSAARFLALSSSGSVRSPFEPAHTKNLEGLVYPATYTIRRTDDETTILEEMVGTFSQHMTALGLNNAAARMHKTAYQVITVASIIQGEAKYGRQFGDVASVIYNRLASGTTLGTDSTLIYALRRTHPNLNVAKVNLEQRNPYNTRLNKGLPPTPIDSPSLTALAAAIKPPHTNLRYFVEVNPDGNLGFASTAAGFTALVAQCQANHLC